ncbi:MAG: hypothetical protein MSA01_04015 [Anaeromassilibacillus sp.]|nr:hypothetical protein [Anaeromassilibacillus sp.]MDY3780008.1 hypothetical protein [Candidatus Limousia pullorum]
MKAKEKPFKTVAAQVRFYLDLNDRNVSWLAKAMGISQSCLYGKMSDPQKFTLGDLEKISKVFKVDTEKFGVIV